MKESLTPLALFLLCGSVVAVDAPAKAEPKSKAETKAKAKAAEPAQRKPTQADVAYGTHERQVLDFWKADSKGPTPLLFHIHGGGWVAGDKARVGNLEKYLAAGISVVSINYRYTTQAQIAGVKPPVQWPLSDAARALQFVRSKAGDWNIDKVRIGASGGSAGACSSLWLAFRDDLADAKSADPIARESTRLWCAAVNGAQTSLDPKQLKEWTPNSRYGGHAFGFMPDPKDTKTRDTQFAKFLAAREEVLPWIKQYSPYEHVTADDPPIYMHYTAPPALGQEQQDPTHTSNYGVKLQEKCKSLGIECELVYPGAPAVKHPGVTEYLIAKLNAAQRVENPIVPEGAALELLHTRQVKLNSGLTEGPAVAPDGSIYFTDLPFGKDNGMILRFDPATKKTTVFTDNSGKSNGLFFDAAGRLHSCDGADGGTRSVRRWDLKTGKSQIVVDRFQGKRFNAPNDLCVDLKGRIYFTDPRYIGTEPRELAHQAVYRIESNGTLIEITHDVETPNGVELSPDQRTMYIVDHNSGGVRLDPSEPEPKRGAMKIYSFPLDANGRVNGPRKTLIDFGNENSCDGLCVDTDGNVYLAARSLKRPGILVINPAGKEVAFIATGAANQTAAFEDLKGIPSNVVFGIGKDSNLLYVTIDKGLHRIRLKTHGFHPQLAGK
ncbi:MAG: hypothetical protein EXS22_02610 [Pedosphaera sp.]|nr:hypothetical protein [Pedosphaera sp.]